MYIQYKGYSLWLHDIGVSAMTQDSDGTVSIKVDVSRQEIRDMIRVLTKKLNHDYGGNNAY